MKNPERETRTSPAAETGGSATNNDEAVRGLAQKLLHMRQTIENARRLRVERLSALGSRAAPQPDRER